MAKTTTALQKFKSLKKTGGVCFYCGEVLGEGFHVDHVFPRSRGGPDTEENIVPACKSCNMKKKNNFIDQFRYTSVGGQWFSEKQKDFLRSLGLKDTINSLVAKRLAEKRFWFEDNGWAINDDGFPVKTAIETPKENL